MWVCSQRSEGTVAAPGARVTGNCEHLNICSEKETPVLWKSSKYCQPLGHPAPEHGSNTEQKQQQWQENTPKRNTLWKQVKKISHSWALWHKIRILRGHIKCHLFWKPSESPLCRANCSLKICPCCKNVPAKLWYIVQFRRHSPLLLLALPLIP